MSQLESFDARPLQGQKALIVGMANDRSIAYGCAKAFRKLGADLAITYASDKTRTYVEPLVKQLEAPIFQKMDVQQPGQLDAVFERIGQMWGKLDIVLHSIAFAPKQDLQGGVLNCSAEGFAMAMDISCHSFIRMAKLAVPLMTNGGTLLAMTYHGANKVIPNYGIMGPVKAALESVARYLAVELGPKGIRVHAVSPGPIKTRAASGLKDFDQQVDEAQKRAPLGELVDIDDVGMATAFLATPYGRHLTGSTFYVDSGLNIMG